MLVGHKKAGKTSICNALFRAVKINQKVPFFIDASVFVGMCRSKKAGLFSIPDLLVVENIDSKNDTAIRFALCVGHERRKFDKDTVLCIDAPDVKLSAIEINWESHEYTGQRCFY